MHTDARRTSGEHANVYSGARQFLSRTLLRGKRHNKQTTRKTTSWTDHQGSGDEQQSGDARGHIGTSAGLRACGRCSVLMVSKECAVRCAVVSTW